MATDTVEPDDYELTSQWSLWNWGRAAIAWLLVGGATVLILAVITVVTASVLGMGV